MPDVPNVSDPVLAVVLDRLNSLTESFKDHREAMKEDVSSLRLEMKTEIAAVRKDQAEVTTVMTKAQGGWLVLMGLGAMLTYVLGFWDKIAKLWH